MHNSRLRGQQAITDTTLRASSRHRESCSSWYIKNETELGAVYDTPHGVACAMMLPIVMEFNQEYTGEKFKDIAEAFGVNTVGMDQATYRKAAIDAVRQLSVDVGIPTKLEKLKEEDLPFLCESAAADACAPGNPRAASLADFEAMFRNLM